MKKFRWLSLALAGALLCACQGGDADIEAQLQQMSLREKVGQLFFIRPEALDTDIFYNTAAELTGYKLQSINQRMQECARDYPMGGVILFAHNIKDPQQLQKMVSDIKALPSHPVLCVDEEGGRVARLANNPSFRLPKFESAAALAASGRTSDVYDAAYTIGSYLHRYGFDIDFAPVADVNTNPRNVVIGNRAFSTDPEIAATMVKSYIKGLRKAGVAGCVKHFPGHGDTQADSHFGYAMSRKSWAEIADCEMLPFRAGIQAGVPIVMTSHISLPNVTGSNVPTTLSSMILQDKLRGEQGFKGVIMSDAMEMGAILRQYPVEDACIMAIQAGVDVLLCVREYTKVFESVMAAVRRGDIPESRIDESVRRILILKKKLASGKV